MNRFAIVLGVLSIVATAFAGDVQLSEKLTPIKVPERMMVFAVSPRADRIAFVVRKTRKKSVVIDGAAGADYDEIKPIGGKQSVLFSSDAKRHAYIARDGANWFVVIDEKPGPALATANDPAFSGDGTTLAYAGVKDGKPVLVTVDAGDTATMHDLPDIADELVVSPDLHHWAYVAQSGGGGDRTVVIDGNASEPFAAASRPVFSADSSRCGFLAKTNKTDGSQDEWIVVDGKKVGPFENLTSLTFSPDAKHYAAIRNAPGGGGPVMPAMPMPGAKPAAPEKAGVVRDGKLEGSYDAIEPPLVFSPDSARLAFVADAGNGRCCVVDGKPGPVSNNVHPPMFSPDSKRVAYAADAVGGVTVVVDGKPGGALNDIANEYALIFSPDSKHLAYLGVNADGTRVPMVDEKPVGTPSRAGVPVLGFSPDSAHLVAQDGTHIWIDGVAVRQDFRSAARVVFDANDRFHTIIARAEKVNRQSVETFYRLDVEIR